MKELPELWELIGLFEEEPDYIYGEEDIPWHYRVLNFKIKRDSITMDINIAPSYDEVGIWIFSGENKIIDMNLQNVNGLKIEKLHDKEILHVLFNDEDDIERFYIETKPHILLHCDKRKID